MTTRSFDGPDCGVDGCEREKGHIGDHRRVEQITPRSIDRAAFGLVDDDGDGYGGRERRHPGDCPATLSYGHDTHAPGCVEYTPWEQSKQVGRVLLARHTDCSGVCHVWVERDALLAIQDELNRLRLVDRCAREAIRAGWFTTNAAGDFAADALRVALDLTA